MLLPGADGALGCCKPYCAIMADDAAAAAAREARADKLSSTEGGSVVALGSPAEPALREIIHGCQLSRAELEKGLLLDTDPGMKDELLEALAAMTDDMLEMQHGIRMTSHRLTPQCQPASGGDDCASNLSAIN